MLGVQMEEENKESDGHIEKFVSHLYCAALAAWSASAGKAPHVTLGSLELRVIHELPAGSGLFVTHTGGISQRYSLSFHHYISPGGIS